MDNKESLQEYIGKSVRARRILKGLTMEQLAEEADLDDTFIGEVERGMSNISVLTLFKLAAGLDLRDPCELLSDAKREVYQTMKETKE